MPGEPATKSPKAAHPHRIRCFFHLYTSDLSHQPSYILPLPSYIIPQPSALLHLTSSFLHHPSAFSPLTSYLFLLTSSLSHQPSYIFPLPSYIIPQPSAFLHLPSSFFIIQYKGFRSMAGTSPLPTSGILGYYCDDCSCSFNHNSIQSLIVWINSLASGINSSTVSIL